MQTCRPFLILAEYRTFKSVLMKITIRKAKSEDAPHVAPIMLEAMREIVYTLIDSKNDDSAIQFLTQFY